MGKRADGYRTGPKWHMVKTSTPFETADCFKGVFVFQASYRILKSVVIFLPEAISVLSFLSSFWETLGLGKETLSVGSSAFSIAVCSFL